MRKSFFDQLQGGVCVGDVLPSEVMFQYEASFTSLFDICKNGFDEKKWSECNDGDGDVDMDRDHKRTPVCAAVATCHRVHFGHILRELATMFFIMPEPLIREKYLILMLQVCWKILSKKPTLQIHSIPQIQRSRYFPSFDTYPVTFYGVFNLSAFQISVSHFNTHTSNSFFVLTTI